MVKTDGRAVFELVAAEFKSAMEQLGMEVSLLKKAHVHPKDFDIAIQVKIDVGA